MINLFEVAETNKMIEQENLDVRTITIGISLLDCMDHDIDVLCKNIYNKITTVAKDLVKTGEEIEKKYGIPIVNKRISVTPIGFVGSNACKSTKDFVKIAKTLDRCAAELKVNFIGGYSAIVSKGMTPAERLLIESIPEAMKVTSNVCSSVNVGSTKTGINMDAVKLMGEIIKETADLTKENLSQFKSGDTLLLTGKILTARDAAHKKIVEYKNAGKPLPNGVDLKDRFIYYVGPVDPVRDEKVGPAGPTTSTRMDKFTKDMMEIGIMGMIGKAERKQPTIDLIKEYKSMYLIATGGAAYLISQSIKDAKVLAFEEMGMEAIYEFDVEDMPVTVAVDTEGTSIHTTGPAKWRTI